MPDYRLTFNGEMVGRLSVPDAFAQAIASAIWSGGRFELSAGFEKADISPRLVELVEFVLSPVPLPEPPETDPMLTDAEREAMEAAADFCEGPAGVGPAGQRKLEMHAATLRGLLKRLGGE